MIKRVGVFSILGMMEGLFYFWLRPMNMEMFFMVWGFIAFAMLIANIFNVDLSANSVVGSIGNREPSGFAGSEAAKSYYEGHNRRYKLRGGIFDSTNLIYLFYVVVNVVGYMIVMPK